MKMVRDLGEKFLKGINVIGHARELEGLRTQLIVPFIILVAGSCVSSLILAAGSWGLFTRWLGAAFHSSLTSLTLHEYMISLVSVLAIAELARQLFGVKARLKKYIEWEYVWRYFKGFALAIAVFVPALFFSQFGVNELFRTLAFYGVQPKTIPVVLWLFFLSIVTLLGCALIVYLFRLSLVFSTYTLAFIMQGRGMGEAILKGSRLFNTQWPYILGLILLFMVCATGIEGFFDFWLISYPRVITSELRGFLLSGLLLLYCALFFSYHRRVSKVPTGR